MELEEPHVLNEEANACAFFPIVICDTILGQQKNILLSYTDLTELPDKVTKEFPEKVNKFRNLSKHMIHLRQKPFLRQTGF